VASIIFEVLAQFENAISEEVTRKRMYSKWKSADIIKAIKEGRPPRPGGPGEPVRTTCEPRGLGVGGIDDITYSDAWAETTGIDANLPINHSTTSASVTPGTSLATSTSIISVPQGTGSGTVQAVAGHADGVTSSNEPAVNSSVASTRNELPRGYNNPGPPSGTPRAKKSVNDAIEFSHFAARALEEENIPLGIERLRQALNALSVT
jgi:hypothetical protein